VPAKKEALGAAHLSVLFLGERLADH